VRFHERLQLGSLVQLLRRWQSLLFLLLVEHHLLDDGACLVIQITQLAILWFNLLRVDLLVALEHAIPPVLPSHLRQIQLENLATL